jgi:hypothetical protein
MTEEQTFRIEILLDPEGDDWKVTIETGFDGEAAPRFRGAFTGSLAECVNATVAAWQSMQVVSMVLAVSARTNLRGLPEVIDMAEAQQFFRSVSLAIRESDPSGETIIGEEMFGRPQ